MYLKSVVLSFHYPSLDNCILPFNILYQFHFNMAFFIYGSKFWVTSCWYSCKSPKFLAKGG